MGEFPGYALRASCRCHVGMARSPCSAAVVDVGHAGTFYWSEQVDEVDLP